jgi:NAD(P)H-dependent FMN reductase
MDKDRREPLRVLVFSASLRADSLTTRLAKVAATIIEHLGASVDLASMRELDAPSYDGDAETVDGFQRKRRRCASALIPRARS